MLKFIKSIPLKVIIPVALILVIAAGLFAAYQLSRVSYDEVLSAGISSSVTIVRDENGVPHVTAGSPEDGFFAIGFLHAKDRFEQIEYFRALATAQTERLLGEQGIYLDRLSYIAGFSQKAKEIETRLKPPHTGYLHSYCQGINYQRSRNGNTEISPRPWTPSDVIAVLLMKEWANSYLNNKELIFHFPERHKAGRLSEIIPDDLLFFYPDEEEKGIELLRQIREITLKYMGSFARGYAFYIPAEKADRDKPIAAFSLENELTVYPGWYPVHLTVKNRTIKGITHAGLPFFFCGDNGSLSFFGFALNLDTQDFFLTKVRKTGSEFEYLSPAGWKKFEASRVPVVGKKGNTKNVLVWKTDDGVVLNDIFSEDEYKKNVVTMKAPLPDSDYLVSLFDIPGMEKIEDAEKAVKGLRSLPRSYLFASGKTVRTLSGSFPVRDQGKQVFFPAEKALAETQTDLASVALKPGIATAGSSVLADAPPQVQAHYLVRHDYSRLRDQIERKLKVGTEDAKALLTERYSLWAELFVPVFVNILKNNPLTSSRLMRIYFQDWDFNMNTTDVAPSLFQMLLQKFMFETLSDEFRESLNVIMSHYYYLVPKFYEMVKKNSSELFDDKSTFNVESRDNIFDRSYLSALRHFNRLSGPQMDDWKYGQYHSGRFYIPLFNKHSWIIRRLTRPSLRPMEGGNSSLLFSSSGLGLEPQVTTSICGFFSENKSSICAYFSYSIDPLSDFFYTNTEGSEFINFHRIDDVYTTTIRSRK